MSVPKISVIVPMYKVEKYVPACIESVLVQTEPDWELLLIDDGSPDESGALARSYAAREARIRVLTQANAGVSAARNAGLDAARGKYIAFLDADDRYEPEMLSTLREALEREEADVVSCGALVIREDGDAAVAQLPIAPCALRGAEAVLEHFLLGEQGLYGVWNRLYRRDVIGDTRFEPYAWAEDALFNTRVMLRCGTHICLACCLYDYRKHAGSISGQSFSEKKLDVVRAWTEIWRLLEQSWPRLAPVAAAKAVHEADKCFRVGQNAALADWPAMRRELKELHRRAYPLQFPNGMPVRKRAAHILYCLSPELFYRLAGRV